MLPWWGWLLLWTVLVVGGGLWIGLLARRAWRSARALTEEVGRAGALVAELEEHLDAVREPDPGRSDVTRDPTEVREEYRRTRERTAAARRERRDAARPPWARHVH